MVLNLCCSLVKNLYSITSKGDLIFTKKQSYV